MEGTDPVELLARLKLKRGQIKSQLTRFSTYLDSFDSSSGNYEEIDTRLEKANFYLEHFNDIQTEIECLTDIDCQEAEREDFEAKFFKTVGRAKKILTEFYKAQNHTGNHISGPSANSNQSGNANVDLHGPVRLPPINLPEFNGAYGHWMTFFDIFNSLVHSNNQLNEVQKFWYLKSCLKGEAAQLIQSIETSNQNYNIAWEMLKTRFENKRLIVHTHIKTIFESVSMKNESHYHLRNLLDNFNKNLRALSVLGQPIDKWDTLLIYIIGSKLDAVTKREWEEFLNKQNVDFPTVTQLTDFLAKRCTFLETIENKNKNERGGHNRILTHVVAGKITCAFCNKNHLNFQCEKIQRMSKNDLYTEVKKHRLCLNCFRPYHNHSYCNASSCKYCGRKHNSLLHSFYNEGSTENNPNKKGPNVNKNVNNQAGSKSTQSQTDALVLTESNQENLNHFIDSKLNEPITNPDLNMHCLSEKNKQIILATAVIKIKNSQGDFIEARAILDSASQSNFMTNTLARQLGLKTQNFNIPVAGINNSCSKISRRADATFCSAHENYKSRDSFLLVDKITEYLPQVSFDISDIHIPCNIQLADKDFNLSRPVDILLGVNIFFDVMCVGQVKLGKNKPVLHKTKLGWVLAGTLLFNGPCKNSTLCNLTITNNDLHKQIEKFWLLENTDNKRDLLPEELACEKHFIETHRRVSQGRFEVSLPITDNEFCLGDSKEIAIKRFLKLEKRFQHDAGLKQGYCNFMFEYEILGHMSPIDKSEIEISNMNYYLPHHAVAKADSTTTKLRVVFDASAKSDTGVSLNDILLTGPVIQRDLLSIIINFRFHNVVFTGDVEKMYRQVEVRNSDRQLQRIVWRSRPQDDLKHYTLNTVTYGTASASFLAIRSLNQVAIEHLEKYPLASRAILNGFYVDDLLTGSDSIENAITLKTQIVTILKNGCFPLRKFYSNKSEVLGDCDRGQSENYDLSEDKTHKTLGLFWHPRNDTFSYSVSFGTRKTITKREILSVIAKIFDPLGLAGPVTVRAKIIMQRLWQCKVGWDESVPVDVYTLWKAFFEELPALDNIKIPRQVTTANYLSIELHGFCDASEVAYGACIYIVTTDANGIRQSKLLCAKSRIAPLKIVSLPRLELSGALLLASLTKKIEGSLDVNIIITHFWCDSTIVLAWIAGEPNHWTTFVANRVTQIHDLTNRSQWRHVGSKDNAADILSRGLSPQQLNNSNLWWNGPECLTRHESYWPVTTNCNVDNIPDKKKFTQFSFVTNSHFKDQSILDKFSNLNKLIRVFAYILRFIFNTNPKNKDNKICGNLSEIDLDRSLNTLIKMVQWSQYANEIYGLRNKNQISKGSKLYSLNPFIDEHDILRVGGRIRHSNLTPDIKHPIVLPPRHNFTKLLIEREHRRNFHAATQALLTILRSRYWIVHGKNEVKRVINQCLVCFKARPSFSTPMMGDLPRARLVPGRPFLTVGCDFAGPIMIKDGKLRSRKVIKAYICIFICFVTRAIHIELVGDLTTASFLNALKRFVSRRGLCKDIYSDNGKNFIGANFELQGILQSIQNDQKDHEISLFLLENDIKWHFIPPRSPTFGGLWEAAVKSTKFHLVRVLKEAYLTFEALSTVLCQVEAILNSRPLTPLSQNPDDLLALTPSHFLIGDMLTSIPQRDVSQVPANRLVLYERLQQLVQHFWKRWSSEYLTSLQSRTKWRRSDGEPVQIGSLVLLREENVPPQQWILGRIVDVHPGRDGVIRVVSVRAKAGVLKRAVTKISVLPLQGD